MEEKIVKRKASYSEELKKHVSQEIAEGRLTWRMAQVQFGIKSQGTIGRWVKDYKKGWVVLPKTDNTIPLKKEDLYDLVLQLKKQLKQSQIQNKVYESIIENAEKELKIDLRKKSFTKQSTK